MEIQAKRVTYKQDPTALEVAYHMHERKPVGVLQDGKKIRHIVLIQESKDTTLNSPHSFLWKLKELLLSLWSQFKEKILRSAPEKIHVTDVKNPAETLPLIDLFEKALLNPQLEPKDRQILEQVQKSLIPQDPFGIRQHIQEDFLRVDLSLQHKEAIAVGDFTRFFNDLTLSVGKRDVRVRSRREKMLKTLQALTETKKEKELMKTLISQIRAHKNVSLDQAVTDALRSHTEQLPRSLKYLLIAGSQTALASVALIITTIIQNDIEPLHLFLTASDERKLKVNVTHDKHGHFSSIRIEQELTFLINTTQREHTPFKKALTVLRIPLRMTTTILPTKREVQCTCPTPPTVVASPSSPGYARYQALAKQISSVFKDISLFL